MATLALSDVHASYGSTPALRGVNLTARPGEITAVVGRNGAGKTTTLHAIAGLVPVDAGTVELDGEPLHRLPIHRISRRGVSLVPQRRRIFPDLTVQENLLVTHRPTPSRADRTAALERAFQLFPILAERRSQEGTTLSGGEQQMLAIARALMTAPTVLLLDEPMEGLAPALVQQVAAAITGLRDEGMTVILVEQIVSLALDLADTVSVLDRGAVAYQSSPAELLADETALAKYLGIGTGLAEPGG